MNKRKLNGFVLCDCGIQYINGYIHCPKCGRKNENNPEIKNKKKQTHAPRV